MFFFVDEFSCFICRFRIHFDIAQIDLNFWNQLILAFIHVNTTSLDNGIKQHAMMLWVAIFIDAESNYVKKK